MKNIDWYQINLDYFDDLATQLNWPKGACTFDRITANLNYIRSLGCTGIWLMPCFERGRVRRKGRGSPYAIYDYTPEERFGTEDSLRQLVQEAKRLGLAVIGEFVPNHLAPDAPFLQEERDLIYRTAEGSPYHDGDWTDVVKLNHSNPRIQGFAQATMIDMLRRYDFDGFRIDMAHYPLHGAIEAAHGAGEPRFWEIVLADPELRKTTKYLLAEVYNDRNNNMYGYGDHFALIRSGMRPYDKRTHDIIAGKLREQGRHWCVQDRLYEEIYIQSQVCHMAGIDCKDGYVPFLRIPSNHDDAPGSKIYGSYERFMVAYAILLLLPGDTMVYGGDEHGYAVKPSVTGIDWVNDAGDFTESSTVKLADELTRQTMSATLNKILNLKRTQLTLNTGHLLFPKLIEADGSSNCDCVAFARYIPERGELLVLAANLSIVEAQAWVKVEMFHPTLDFPKHQFTLKELMGWIAPRWIEHGYKLCNLFTGEVMQRKPDAEFWLGLNPLEVQLWQFRSIDQST